MYTVMFRRLGLRPKTVRRSITTRRSGLLHYWGHGRQSTCDCACSQHDPWTMVVCIEPQLLTAPRGGGAKYCDQPVCVSVCGSVCLHVANTECSNFTKFSVSFTPYVFGIAVARSSSSMQYLVRPVLWMMPCFQYFSHNEPNRPTDTGPESIRRSKLGLFTANRQGAPLNCTSACEVCHRRLPCSPSVSHINYARNYIG